MTAKQGEELLQTLGKLERAILDQQRDEIANGEFKAHFAEMRKVVAQLRTVVLEGNGKKSLKATAEDVETMRGDLERLTTRLVSEEAKGKHDRVLLLIAVITTLGSVATAIIATMGKS